MPQLQATDRQDAALRVRRLAAPMLGLSFTWPMLHASPYYPFALSQAAMARGAAAVSGYHALYSTELILACALVLVLCRVARTPAVPVRALALAAGAAGGAGGALVVLADGLGGASGAVSGIAVTLVAFALVALLASWFAVFARLALGDIFLAAVASYAVSSLAWLALQAALPALVVPFVVLCPLASAGILVAAVAHDAVGASSLSGLKSLRWGIIVYCLALSCLVAVCVRIFTTMELGSTPMGDMVSERGIMTAVCSFAMCIVGIGYCWRVRSRVSFLIVLVAFVSLVAVGSLMVVVLANSQGLPALVGKRMFISVEHCLDVLVFAVLAYGGARHKASPLALAGIYGIGVCAIPQLVSFDLMYQVGALDAMESVDLVIPIAALLTFAVTAVVVAGLISYVARMTHDINEQSGNWERALCEKAMAAAGLTPRELDVVELTYRGYTAKSIAKELLVSESTVKAHLAHAYRKLDVHTKQALIEHIDSYRGM